MKKGVDYTGIAALFFCHDGQGNYAMLKRSENCKDEQGCWEFGGGGLDFGEKLHDAVVREVSEEFGTTPLEIEFLGHDEGFRTNREGASTHWIFFHYKVLVNREEVKNCEPEMHDELIWATLDKLPTPLHSALPHELEMYKDKL